MNLPPFPDGAIAVRAGRIAAVGPSSQITLPNAEIRDFGNAVILPGLINAHVHLELSDLNPGVCSGKFTSWLADVVRRGPPAGEAGAARIAEAVANGLRQCARFGVTWVGDISQRCAVTRPLLRNGPLRVVSFGEVLAMAGRRQLLDERLASAADRSWDHEWLTTGVSPHAPYSIELEGYRRCLARAQTEKLPLATHLAESPEEAEFLADHKGVFRELWDRIGGWDEHVPRFAGGPIRFAAAIGLLDYERTLLAHVNYCDDDELKLLASGRASVVYCPRTHSYFGHRPHRWREMHRLGINVAVGTDSCASSPDLNLVADLRLLHQIAPDEPIDRLWEMATINGARALGLSGGAGELRVGAVADFVVFPASGGQPLREILESDALPIAVNPLSPGGWQH